MSDAGWLSAFRDQVERTPDALALRIPDGPATTFSEFLREIEELRAAIQAGGLVAGESVVLFLPSGPDLLRAFAATTSLGVIAVPLSPSLTAFELPRILDLARPSAVVTYASHWADLAPALAGVSELRQVVVLGEEVLSAPPGAPWKVSTPSAETSPLEEPTADAIVGCHFTYKGLGEPLGALHRYSSYGRSANSLVKHFEDPAGPKPALAVLPFHQVYALVSSVIAPLISGCPLVLPSRFSPRHLLKLLVDERARYACLIPALLPFLNKAARRSPELVAALDPNLGITAGGSLLSRELALETEAALGVPPYQGYGLSETLPIVANTPQANLPGSLGRALDPETKISIRDADGGQVPAGVAGEIWVAGPTLMTGYLRRPRETAHFCRDGWMKTGDLGHLDAGGVLHFLGRRGAFTKVGGQMVDLREVESVLEGHQAVAKACAFARPGKSGQTELVAAVILAGRSGVRLGELFALARERLSPHKVPRRLKIYRAHYERFDADF
ncbi:MAG: acyl--CoA ligase [Planctomycetes bacterium]|nr:acyl--CoA ligase [Planctomycetota bacterium]